MHNVMFMNNSKYTVTLQLTKIYLIKLLPTTNTKMMDYSYPKSSKFRKKYICANLLFFTSLFTCSAPSDGGAMKHSTSSLDYVLFVDSRPEQTRNYETAGKINAINGLLVNRGIINQSRASSKNKQRTKIKLNSDTINFKMKLLASNTGEGSRGPILGHPSEHWEKTTELPYTGPLKGGPTGVKNPPPLTDNRRKRNIISSMENDFNHDKNKHEKFPALSQVKAKVESILSGGDNGSGKLFSGSNFDDFHQNMERRDNNLAPEIYRGNYDAKEAFIENRNNITVIGRDIFDKVLQNEENKMKNTEYKRKHRIRHTAKKGGHREEALRDVGHREIKPGFQQSNFRLKITEGLELGEYAGPSKSLSEKKRLQLMMKGNPRRTGGGNSSDTPNQNLSVRFPIKTESSSVTLKRKSNEKKFLNVKELIDINDLEDGGDSSISSSDDTSFEAYLYYKNKKNNLKKSLRKHKLYLEADNGEDYNSETLPAATIKGQTFVDSDGSSFNKIKPYDVSALPSTSSISTSNGTKDDPYGDTTASNTDTDYTMGFLDVVTEEVRETSVRVTSKSIPLKNDNPIVAYPENDFDLHNSLHNGKNLLTTTSEAALLLAIPLALLLTLIILTFAACCCYRHRQLHFVQHEEKGQIKLLGYYDEFGHNPDENVVGCCGCRALESCCLPDLSYQLHRAEWVKKHSIADNEKSFVVFEDDLELAADVAPDLLGHPPLYDLLSNLPPRKRRLSHNGRKSYNRKTNLRKTKSVEHLCV